MARIAVPVLQPVHSPRDERKGGTGPMSAPSGNDESGPFERAPLDPGTLTRLMRRAATGDGSAEEAFYEAVYAELLVRARACVRQLPPGATIGPADLVSELYLRLRDARTQWNDSGHFFGFAARALRSIVVDHARARGRQKRSAEGDRVPLDGLLAAFERTVPDVVALDEALSQLSTHDEREARIVELRFFAGLSCPEIAASLGIPLRTVERDWSHARLWLRRVLG
jgi:RNA polymerase sigma factor (TIGR02999 family)